GAFEVVTSNDLLLPIIHKGLINQPDLVITGLTASSSGVTVTIQNNGTTATSNAFWVDVYFGLTSPPSLNQPWKSTDAVAGAVWGVTKSLAPGETLVLTVGDTYYDTGESSGSFPSGVTVYAFADSINHSTAVGNVVESDEGNNVFGAVTSTVGTGTPPTVVDQASENDRLPNRE
ncbi:MAG: hypothetical protein AAF485_24860, partial [Chloroflexota bacterium]